MRKLILVSKTPIIIQIFTLVCKKLDIKLEVLKEAQVDHKVDIIIVDKELIDDRFNILKTYSKLIGAISKNELPFEMANDFLVPLPFLPSTLQKIIEDQLVALQKKESSKTYISNIEVDNIDYYGENTLNSNDNELEPAVEYLENLADGIIDNINEETDDSLISMASLNDGGILDSNELSKIGSIIEPDSNYMHTQKKEFDQDDQDEDWLDLSSIIDNAINEVNTTNVLYTKFDNKPIKVLLNNYNLTELTPLLNMLDQDIINTLTDGYEVTIQLKLGAENE